MAASSPMEGGFAQASQCFICQETIRSPKVLPCNHTYCSSCLQSHINSTVVNRGTKICFPCPVCMVDTTSPVTTASVEDWADLFPVNIIEFPKMDVPMETFGDKLCCFCLKWNRRNAAKSFCKECKRFMCKICDEHHNETLRHDVLDLSIENDYSIASLSTIEKCPNHLTKNIKSFCIDHNLLCCTTCGFYEHRKCENVIPIDNMIETFDAKAKSKDLEASLSNIGDHMKELTSKVKEYTDNIKSDKATILHQIRSLRAKINDKLKKLEDDLIASLDEQYKTEELSLQKQEIMGESLISAIDGDLNQIDLVMTHGSAVQKIIMLHNIEKNHNKYNMSISEYQEDLQYIKFGFEVNTTLTDLINVLNKFGDIRMTRSRPKLPQNPAANKIQLKDRKAVKVSEFNVKEHGDNSCCFLSDILILKGGKHIFIDWNNEKIKMYGENYQLQDSMKLEGNPSNVCMLPDNNIAVTIPDDKTILVIGIEGKMHTVREIKTRLRCWGIAVMKDQLVITTGRDQHSVLILDINGTEIRTVEPGNRHSEEPLSPYYISIDEHKTITYLTFQNIDKMIAYNAYWDNIFTYINQDMNEPRGIDTDREGNIYLCGQSSFNVQQISAAGKLIKTLITRIEDQKRPLAIKFYRNMDRFLVTYNDCNIVEVYDM